MKRSTNVLTTQSPPLLDRPAALLSRFPLERARTVADLLDHPDKDPHFMAMMSHEIRTPMNSLLGMLELLSNTVLTPEQRNMLRVSRDSARTLARVADDVLDISKIGADRVVLESVPVDIRQLIMDVVTLLRADSRRRQLTIRHEIDAGVAPALLSDPVRLRQILLNLATNALKFTERGEIVLQVFAKDVAPTRPDCPTTRTAASTATASQNIVIRVIDSGMGMSPETLAQAWEPFIRGACTTSDVYEGTGLGLTIAKQLACRLGGDLTMDSIPERGTTATLTLELRYPEQSMVSCISSVLSVPRRHIRSYGANVGKRGQRGPRYAGERGGGIAGSMPAKLIQATALRAPRARSRTGIGTAADLSARRAKPAFIRAFMLLPGQTHCAPSDVSLRILIADDHPASRLVIHGQLAQLGHHADVVENGAIGLAHLRQRRYDVLLTDYRMPDMDGYALVTAWRQLEAAGALPMPVIGLSANPRADTLPMMPGFDLDDRLVKPITLAQLNTSLCTVLQTRPRNWTSHVIDFARGHEDIPLVPAIDMERLAKSFGGTQVLHQILHAFIVATKEDLMKLRPFMSKADPRKGACRMRLHRIIGGLQVLGNLALAEEGATLELQLIRCSDHAWSEHHDNNAEHGLHGLWPQITAGDVQEKTIGALRTAIRQFCIRVTLHIDWLIRQLAP